MLGVGKEGLTLIVKRKATLDLFTLATCLMTHAVGAQSQLHLSAL